MELEDLQAMLDRLFGEDDGTTVDAVVIMDALTLRPPVLYIARLLGLEDEPIMEIEVRPDLNGRPPEEINVPLARQKGHIKYEPPPSKPMCFDVVVYRLVTVCGANVAYYKRITPPFREE